MAKARRLLVVVAGLAAAALVSSSQSHGDPAGKNDRPNLTPAGPKAPVAPVIQGKNVDDEPSVSRFALGRTITYRPLEGEPYFALQIQPKPEQIQPKADADAKPRGREYLIMISTSATQAGVARTASLQILEATVKNARPNDTIAVWSLCTPESTKCHSGDFVEPKDAKL